VNIIEALLEVLPHDIVDSGDYIDDRYMGDWVLTVRDASPLALVRPRTTEQVAKTLELCHATSTPVVTQGGLTGMAGGAAPVQGCVLLSMERMRALSPVDPSSATIEAEAGVTLEAVQKAAEEAGLLFALDIGARGSCTIGGNIATNAGGNRVLRYGMMREQLLGLETVLADGTILTSLNVMLKNNTGYDLKHLFVGSEGTLGVITRAVLKLHPLPVAKQTALCAVDSFTSAVRLLQIAKARLGSSLSAFEVMWPSFYEGVTSSLGLRPPLDLGHGAYILLDSMGTDPDANEAEFQTFIESSFSDGVILDAVIAQTERQALDLWAIRDASGEFPKFFSPYIPFDVSIPIGRMEAFIGECDARLLHRWPDIQALWFGHIADSNIHVAVHIPGVDPLPEHDIDTTIYDCVGEYGGAISAEHGIGVLKREFLDRSRSAAEIATMRTIKQALDPRNILNPGKVLVNTALGDARHF